MKTLLRLAATQVAACKNESVQFCKEKDLEKLKVCLQRLSSRTGVLEQSIDFKDYIPRSVES